VARKKRTAVEGISEQGPSDENPETTGLVLDKNLGTVVAQKTADYTLTAWDQYVEVDATAGAVTLTLPAANSASISLNNLGAWYRVVKTDASGNAVTVARAGSDTINGGTTVSTTTQYGCIDVHCVAATVWRAITVR
jgi:hypothetical protein